MTGRDDDKQRYRDSCQVANDLINRSRSDHHYSTIESLKNVPRRKWSAIREILHPPNISPSITPDEEKVMSQQLADFFHEKVANIQLAISSRLGDTVHDSMKVDTVYHGIPLNNLMAVTEAEVLKILSSMNGNISSRDSIPTTLIKECSCTFSSIMVRLENLSFSDGVFRQHSNALRLPQL